MTNEQYTAMQDDLYKAWRTAHLSEQQTGYDATRTFYQGQKSGFAWAACYLQQYMEGITEYTTPFRMEARFMERYTDEQEN